MFKVKTRKHCFFSNTDVDLYVNKMKLLHVCNSLPKKYSAKSSFYFSSLKQSLKSSYNSYISSPQTSFNLSHLFKQLRSHAKCIPHQIIMCHNHRHTWMSVQIKILSPNRQSVHILQNTVDVLFH